MRLIFPVLLALAAVVAAPLSARAQESDEALKKRIMDKIKERLAEEHKAILERVSKAIDEELSGKAKLEPAPAPKSAEPKSAEKRLKDLERKLKALDDQREDVLRDIRGVKREVDDAEIIDDATKSGPQTGQEAQDEFKSYFDTHDEATKLLKKDRDQAAKKFEKSIAGFKRLYYALRSANPEAMRALGVPSAYNVACGYALIGQNEKAIDWLEVSVKAGYDDFDHMRQDSDLDGLRKERRYLRLLADR